MCMFKVRHVLRVHLKTQKETKNLFVAKTVHVTGELAKKLFGEEGDAYVVFPSSLVAGVVMEEIPLDEEDVLEIKS